MLGKKKTAPSFIQNPPPSGHFSNWPRITGLELRGKGGVRIEGTVDGEIAVQGLLVMVKQEK